MSRTHKHTINAESAEVLGLHDVRWLRKDELVRVFALVPNAPEHARTLAGCLRNGRVRLTPSAQAWAETRCANFTGKRSCDKLAHALELAAVGAVAI